MPRAGLRERPSSPWQPGPHRAPLQSRAPSAHVLGSASRPTATPAPPRCSRRLSAATVGHVSAKPKESLRPSPEQRATPPGEHAPRRRTSPHRTPGPRPVFTPRPAFGRQRSWPAQLRRSCRRVRQMSSFATQAPRAFPRSSAPLPYSKLARAILDRPRGDRPSLRHPSAASGRAGPPPGAPGTALSPTRALRRPAARTPQPPCTLPGTSGLHTVLGRPGSPQPSPRRSTAQPEGRLQN